jgi:hypothetical protein
MVDIDFEEMYEPDALVENVDYEDDYDNAHDNPCTDIFVFVTIH